MAWFRVSLSGLVYAVGLLPPAIVLYQVTGASGCRTHAGGPTLTRCVAAQLLGHAGKYVPGKAVVIVLRVGALRGVQQRPVGFATRATMSVFFETLLMMSVGGSFAGVLLWSTPLPTWVHAGAAAMAVLAAIPTLPPVMRSLLQRVAGRRLEDPLEPAATWQPNEMGWPLLFAAWFWSLLSWLCIGTSFALLITAIPIEEVNPATRIQLWLAASSAISLGMVLGFASLVPGGAGVREYVTLLVLTPVIGPTHGLLSVIAARMLFIVVEAIMAAISYGILASMNGSSAGDPRPE
ncbi:MAG: hypothetical protein AAGC97_13800 [Planctomycetota bacterium]